MPIISPEMMERVSKMIQDHDDPVLAITETSREVANLVFVLLDSMEYGEVDEGRLSKALSAVPHTLIFLIAAYLSLSKDDLNEQCDMRLKEFEEELAQIETEKGE